MRSSEDLPGYLMDKLFHQASARSMLAADVVLIVSIIVIALVLCRLAAPAVTCPGCTFAL